MKQGTVKFFDEKKGFGFIKDDEGGKDIFVHKSGLNDTVNEGDRVTFDTKEEKKGLCAINVSLARGRADEVDDGG